MFNRLFPIGRGLFEDKVANFWCALNVLFKIQQSYPVDTLAMICAIATGIFSLPSNVILFLKPSRQNFLLALMNTSLIFFLFSFQVIYWYIINIATWKHILQWLTSIMNSQLYALFVGSWKIDPVSSNSNSYVPRWNFFSGSHIFSRA